MKELSPLEKQAREAMIEILQDVVHDYKRNLKRLQAIIVLMTILLVGTFVYYEWNFKNFMSQYDYENSVTTTTNVDTKNDNKIYDKNSSITAHINDIKVNAPNPIKR